MKVNRLCKYIKNFGIINTFKWNILKRINKEKYHNSLYLYIKNEFINGIDSNYINTDNYCEKNIWLFWSQGKDNMPEIVSICYESILRNRGEYSVVLLDRENYKKYISLEPEITRNFNNGNITLTHFSDILRVKLLNKYGGIWLDATDFLVKELNIKEDIQFISCAITNGEKYISRGRWSVFFMGTNCIHYPLFYYLEQLYSLYYRNYDLVIDYYMFDYFIKLIYEIDQDVRNALNQIEKTDIYWLQSKLDEPFSYKEWNSKLKANTIFKLSYKIKSSKKHNTYYDYLCKTFLENIGGSIS
jgi:hypothetical protein